jgi:hypothetical protein
MLKSTKLSLRPAWATLSKIKGFGSLAAAGPEFDRGALIERKVSLAGHPYDLKRASALQQHSTSPLPRPEVKI